MEGGKNIRKRNAYTIEYKLYILNIAESKGLHYIESTFGISRATVSGWRNNKDKLEKKSKKRISFRIKGGGRKPLTSAIEDKLIKWIKYCRGLMIPITTNDVIVKSIIMFPSLENYKYNTMNVWCHRFLKRHGYTLRTKTHYGQAIKKNAKELQKIFINIIKNLRK